MSIARLFTLPGMILLISLPALGVENGEGPEAKTPQELREEARAYFGSRRFAEAWKACRLKPNRAPDRSAGGGSGGQLPQQTTLPPSSSTTTVGVPVGVPTVPEVR